MNKNYYTNKNVLVIGGTFGIGEELCKNLASIGANVCISGRNQEKISQILQNLEGKNLGIKCNISSIESIQNLHDEIFKTWQKIDIIIFCAGTYEPMNINNFNLQKAQEIIETNLVGFIKFQSVFNEACKKEKIGQYVVFSSIAGYFGMSNSLAYGASKAGLTNFVESLYYELKPFNIKVQIVNPGFVKTRLTDKNSFKMPSIITPEIAAKVIINKMQKKCFEIRFPFAFAFIMRLLSILPYKLRFAIVGKATTDS